MSTENKRRAKKLPCHYESSARKSNLLEQSGGGGGGGGGGEGGGVSTNKASLSFGRTSAGIVWCFLGSFDTIETTNIAKHNSLKISIRKSNAFEI